MTTADPSAPGLAWAGSVARSWLFYAGSLLGLTYASGHGLGLTLLAVAVVVTAALLLHQVLKIPEGGTSTEVRRRRLMVTLGMSTIGLVLLGLWMVGGHPNGWALVGVGTLFFGAGQALAEWRDSDWWRGRRGMVIVAACAAAFTLGFVALVLRPGWWPVILMLAGILASPVGLNLWSQDLVRAMEGQPPRWLLAGAGVATAGMVWLWSVAGMPALFAIAVSLAVGGMVLAIASNTRADVIIVVCSLAVVWVAINREVALNPWVDPQAGDSVIVSLGDSFMSGEGAETYFEGTNTKGENECRRADTAYAATLSEPGSPVKEKVAFLACSGATAVQVYRDPQYPGEPIDGPETDGTRLGLDQLDHFDWLRDRRALKPKLVIIGIGGNDAGFGEIAQTCVGPGNCAELGRLWLKNLDAVSGQLHDAFAEVDHRFKDVPVVVVPYPIPVGERPCDWVTLEGNELTFVSGFTNELDEVQRRAAQQFGFHYVDDMRSALVNLRLCDGRPGEMGVNFLAANPTNGLSEQTLNPQNWVHNSMHPNARGHRAMRDALIAWMAAHPDPAPRLAIEQPTGTVKPIEAVMHETPPVQCDSGDSYCTPSTWLMRNTVVPLLRVLPGLLLVIGGSWMLCLFFLRQRQRARVRTREP